VCVCSLATHSKSLFDLIDECRPPWFVGPTSLPRLVHAPAKSMVAGNISFNKIFPFLIGCPLTQVVLYDSNNMVVVVKTVSLAI